MTADHRFTTSAGKGIPQNTCPAHAHPPKTSEAANPVPEIAQVLNVNAWIKKGQSESLASLRHRP